LGASAI
jgi:hypothetical protein